MSNDWFGIDRQVADPRPSEAVEKPVTLDAIREAGRRLFVAQHRGPEIEYHHPQCPKILTGKACRCSAVPLEGIFEDALETKT